MMQKTAHRQLHQSRSKPSRLIRCVFILASLLVGLELMGARPAHADIINYQVNLGTTPLANVDRNNDTQQDTFRLDFFFNNGTTPNNSSVTLSNFDFGGGSGTPATPASFTDTNLSIDSNGLPVPNSTGSLTTPGNFLNFSLDFNPSIDTPTPDNFSFALFNVSDNNYVITDDSPDGISLFTIDFNSSMPNIQTYGSTDYGLAPPTITATPEPETWAMMALGLGSLILPLRRRKLSSTQGIAA